ncbi:MAG: Maf family protein [Verrucomicrobiales bacterium]|jgi:septum formation protein|nr:Maf family protein [Verrucomicrobiales bacterium]
MPAAPKLILASGSPRRSDLLKEAGYDFEVIKPDIEEIEDGSLPIREVTADNARLKAEAVSRANPEAVVIAADTLVLLGDRNLSKPLDREEAASMLKSLNGNSHQVFTAVTILRATPEKQHRFTIATDVHFKNLSEWEMETYHAKIDPMDKAGAYAAQEHGELIIDRIEGSMTNVIGLPMDEVTTALAEEFGITPRS